MRHLLVSSSSKNTQYAVHQCIFQELLHPTNLCQHTSDPYVPACIVGTVQSFNSCTSRPEICQCLVVQTTMENMSKNNAKHTNDLRSLQMKTTISCEVIRPSIPRKLAGNRACGCVLCPDCPRI